MTAVDVNELYAALGKDHYRASDLPGHVRVPDELQARILAVILDNDNFEEADIYDLVSASVSDARAGTLSDEVMGQVADTNGDLDVDLDEMGDFGPMSLNVFRLHVLDTALRIVHKYVVADILRAAGEVSGETVAHQDDLELEGTFDY